jgi:predicted dehydrogenase
MARIGIGLVGAGMVGQMCHLANFAAQSECRVVALSELRPELGRRAAERFGVPRIYGTHTELLADPDVTAVIVVTRRAATGPVVLDALTSGRHVLSEKPMAHSVAQGRRLARAASERGLVYAVGYMKRHDAGVASAKGLVERVLAEGTLGRMLLARGWCYGGNTAAPSDVFVMTGEPRPEGLTLWPGRPHWLPEAFARDYDRFLNVHVHMINLMRYILGVTPRVAAVASSDRRTGIVSLDFAGIPATMEVAEVSSDAWHEGLELLFERGSIRIELPPPFRQDGVARVVEHLHGAPARPIVIAPDAGWAFARQARAFLADVAAGATPVASGADAVHDLEVAEAIWRHCLRADLLAAPRRSARTAKAS